MRQLFGPPEKLPKVSYDPMQYHPVNRFAVYKMAREIGDRKLAYVDEKSVLGKSRKASCVDFDE